MRASHPAASRTASSRKRWPTRHPTAWWTGWKNWLTGWSAPREKNESSSRRYRARHRHLLVQRLQDAAAIYRRAGVPKLPELVRPGTMGAGGRAERTRIAGRLEFGHFQAAAPHGWGMLQLAGRAKLARAASGRWQAKACPTSDAIS